jgi:hypothetical protein
MTAAVGADVPSWQAQEAPAVIVVIVKSTMYIL